MGMAESASLRREGWDLYGREGLEAARRQLGLAKARAQASDGDVER